MGFIAKKTPPAAIHARGSRVAAGGVAWLTLHGGPPFTDVEATSAKEELQRACHTLGSARIRRDFRDLGEARLAACGLRLNTADRRWSVWRTARTMLVRAATRFDQRSQSAMSPLIDFARSLAWPSPMLPRSRLPGPWRFERSACAPKQLPRSPLNVTAS